MANLNITQTRVQPSKRGPNRAEFIVRDAFDKEKRKERTFHDENDATDHRLKLEERALAIVRTNGPRMTFREVGKEMLVNQTGRLRPSTLVNKGYRFDRVCRQFGDRDIADITGDELIAYIKLRRLEDPSANVKAPPSSQAWSILSEVFSYALDTKRVGLDPISDVALPKRPRLKYWGPKPMPTADQVRVMLTEPPTFLLKALSVSLLLGTRFGETIALNKQDFSPHDGSFQVWKQHDGGEPKTEAGFRFAPAIDLLRKRLEIEGDGADFASEYGPLLLDRKGRPLSYYQYWNSFYNWQVEIGWATKEGNRYRGHLTVQQLRHAFVALGLWTGVPIEAISAAMGHSGSAVTEHSYAYLISEKEAGLETWGVATPKLN